MEHDLSVSGGGSLYLLHPMTEAGLDWVREKVDVPEWVGEPRMGVGVPVEHRYIRAIIEGAQDDGLSVEA